MAPRDEITSQRVVVVGIVVAILLFSFVVAVQVVYHVLYERERQSKLLASPVPATAAALVQQQGALFGYRWVDREQGVVAIPIDRAMELTVQRYGGEAEGR